jgi:hypothetical protein
MAAVRCPKCGTINPNGHQRLARCARCREALGKCRYCHFFNARMIDCTHPARPEELRIVDLDQVLNCRDFTTLLTPSPPRERLFRLLRTAAIAVVASLVVMLGAVRLYRLVTQVPPPVLLDAAVSVPEECYQESGLDITLLVKNKADHAAKDVQVVISGQTMPRLTCQYVEPPEAFAEATSKSTSAWLGEIAPGDIASVSFHFQPQKAGKVDLLARVVAENMEGPTRIHIDTEVLP